MLNSCLYDPRYGSRSDFNFISCFKSTTSSRHHSPVNFEWGPLSSTETQRIGDNYDNQGSRSQSKRYSGYNFVTIYQMRIFLCKRELQTPKYDIKVCVDGILVHNIIIFPVVLYGCETWSLTLWEVQRLYVFETGCWGEYLDQRGMKWQEIGDNCIMRSFITCTLLQV
jgi:hypothetical protein